ncbi:MAG TPA: hypothetical protein VMW66_02355, partial [Elusimicrobiales bacterium]|nr:hypothetical protein [Elusimicrobiales bacterium]
ITNPTMTAEISAEDVDVSWEFRWRRWDTSKYTFEYPDDYEDIAAEADLIYHMKYSKDNGATWYFCNTTTVTTPGERSLNSSHIITGLTKTWDVPTADFPEGIYLLRVEVFRNSIASHYAYDQQRIFVKR